jgi:tetratricopeptide (TPR) repeat protein
MFLSAVYFRWMVFLLLCAIALCFVQLFHLLAFEFAFAVALLISLSSGHLGIREYQLSQSQLFRRESPWSVWLRASWSNSILALVPLIPITLNGLRIKNCNWIDGFLFYLLLPMISVWIATGWGVFLAFFKRGIWSFIALVICSIAWGFWLFYSTPAVDIFHIFLGYYPGAIYDEEVILGWRLILSRLEDLIWVIVGLSVLDFLQSPEKIKSRLSLTFYICLLMGLYWVGIQFDIHRSATHVQKRLGATQISEHFIFYYPHKWDKKEIDLLEVDFEFAHQQLSSFFKQAPKSKISVYLYNDIDMKKRLMGAGNTLIAKPWQMSIHLHQILVGEDVILHELSHIFATEFANAPLYISMQGLIPHMPIIEGVAEAATWDGERLNHHQWSAAMREAGFAPPMKSLFSPEQFYLYSGKLAYTMCGSFIRFYTEKKGVQHLESFYRRGEIDGGDEELEKEILAWEKMLSEIKLSAQAQNFAKEYFNRPAIFKKICAHEMANLRQKANRLHLKKKWQEALDQWEEILSYLPLDQMATQKKMEIYFQIKDIEALKKEAQKLIDHEFASNPMKRKAKEWLLDLSEIDPTNPTDNQIDQSTKITELQNAYTSILNELFDRSTIRRIATKLEILKYPQYRREILSYLLGLYEIDQMKDSLEKMIEQVPKWALAHYLYAKLHMMKQQSKVAFVSFENALQFGLPHPSLTFEAELKRAEILFQEKEFIQSANLYEKLAQRRDLGIEDGERYALLQWQKRALFFQEYFGRGQVNR